MADFHGIIGYSVTPFTSDDKVDTDALTALIDRMVVAGVHAIAPLGSTGELAYLDDDEFDTVVDTSIAAVDRRVPVIFGVSAVTTARTVRRARRAQDAGADAVMVVPVSYWKLSEREVVEHYSQISDAIDIPIMVYNNPATSGIDMKPELLVSMFDTIENVTMVKESTGDLNRMLSIAKLSDGRLPFYNGSNPLVLDALRVGATGWCTAAPNLRAAECLSLYAAILAGDLDGAQAIYDDLQPLLRFIVSGGLPTTIKAGLELLDVRAGAPRRPLLPLDEPGRAELQKLLDAS